MVWHAQVAIKTTKSVKLQILLELQPGADSIAFDRGIVFIPMSFSEPERRVTSVIPHTYAIGLSVHRGANGGGIDYVSDQRPARSRDDFLFRIADYRRQDGSDEIVCGKQPRRIAGGIGCRAAPVALTKGLPASTRKDRRLSEGRRLVDASGGSA
jgi:hypothetical protein